MNEETREKKKMLMLDKLRLCCFAVCGDKKLFLSLFLFLLFFLSSDFKMNGSSGLSFSGKEIWMNTNKFAIKRKKMPESFSNKY